jgi:hypothetical protein
MIVFNDNTLLIDELLLFDSFEELPYEFYLGGINEDELLIFVVFHS